MFAKTIIDSDAFLDMPLSTQSLYFHLSMRADDDGFINNPKKIQRMVGCSDDDLRLLIAKNFIIPFESGIVVIKHWKIHNYIRGDRKKDTVYPEEMALLIEKENGAYSLKTDELILLDDTNEETKRQKAYRESSLPYSFEYKIRQAFYGEPCPVCGFDMKTTIDECGISSDIHKPSIQHNIPISKGGKHELGNISVICHNCNVSLQDTETGKLNADEVIKKWDEICMSVKCQSNVSQMSVKCQHRLGKDSIVEDSIDNISDKPTKNKKFIPPTLEEIKAYCKERNNNVDAEKFYEYFRVSDWYDSKGQKVKSWKQKIITWERSGYNNKPQQVNNQPQVKEFDFRLDGIAESGSEYMMVDGKMYNRYGKELNSRGYEIIDFGLEKGR